MAQQTINIGESPNDHTGDVARTAFQKVNANFTEVYEAIDELEEGKSDAGHTHAISDVTGLQAALDAKATSAALSTEATTRGDADEGLSADIAAETAARQAADSTLQSNIDAKANVSHTHAQSDVTGLVSDLAGKAAASHTHAISDVTGLQGALDGKAEANHTHDASNISGTIDPGILPTPTLTTIGGVMRNTGAAGQFVTGIAVNGALTFDTPAGGAGSPAGSGQEIQANNGGSFGATGVKAWDPATGESTFGSDLLFGLWSLGPTGGFQRKIDSVWQNAIGTGPYQLVALDGDSKLPAVDGSQLTGVPTEAAVAAAIAAAISSDSGWTGNESNGDKSVIVSNYTAVDFSDLDVSNIGLNTLSAQVAALTKKLQAIEHALASKLLPDV